MKKSGNVERLTPPARRYVRIHFPATNAAAQGMAERIKMSGGSRLYLNAIRFLYPLVLKQPVSGDVS